LSTSSRNISRCKYNSKSNLHESRLNKAVLIYSQRILGVRLSGYYRAGGRSLICDLEFDEINGPISDKFAFNNSVLLENEMVKPSRPRNKMEGFITHIQL
jgi:hypothetical protein